MRFVILLTLLAGPVAGREPILGGPCEGCEAVFEGQPARPASSTRIAPPGEPGEPLVLEGRVTTLAGAPAAGIVVYAYHTDHTGIYPPVPGVTGVARRHGRLRAWAITDQEGRYEFITIRPGSYPSGNIPAHVHLHVIEPGRGTYYIDDVHFEDDPLLTAAQRRHLPGRGGPGIARPSRDKDGAWHVRRDIILGLGISDYPR